MGKTGVKDLVKIQVNNDKNITNEGMCKSAISRVLDIHYGTIYKVGKFLDKYLEKNGKS